MVICDCTTLTQAGYVGDDIESVIVKLLHVSIIMYLTIISDLPSSLSLSPFLFYFHRRPSSMLKKHSKVNCSVHGYMECCTHFCETHFRLHLQALVLHLARTLPTFTISACL